MKTYLTTLLLGAQICGMASADTVVTLTPVETSVMSETTLPDQLRLVGRGVQGRGLEQSVALACSNEACSEVRFVYFEGPQQARWIGSAFEHRIETAKIERLTVEEYLLEHSTETTTWVGRQQWMSPFLVFIVAPAAVGAAIASGGSSVLVVGALFGPGILLVGGDALVKNLSSKMVSSDQTESFTISKGEMGWNWSSQPSEISAKRFAKLVTLLEAGSSRNPPRSYYRTNNKIKRELKRYARDLEEQDDE